MQVLRLKNSYMYSEKISYVQCETFLQFTVQYNICDSSRYYKQLDKVHDKQNCKAIDLKNQLGMLYL